MCDVGPGVTNHSWPGCAEGVCAPFLSPAVLLPDPGTVGIKALSIPEWLPLPMREPSWVLSTGVYLCRSAKGCYEVIQG